MRRTASVGAFCAVVAVIAGAVLVGVRPSKPGPSHVAVDHVIGPARVDRRSNAVGHIGRDAESPAGRINPPGGDASVPPAADVAPSIHPANPAERTELTSRGIVAHPTEQNRHAEPVAVPSVNQRELARNALVMVGANPIAELIWYDAINDPERSAHERSDLIEELKEEGFPDPKHVTVDDLPLIENRLVLIEQLAPDAMDDVNAEAFAEAYKDLVNMYLRAAGQ